MLASLQQWNPSVPLNCQLLWAATGARGKKFEWTEDMKKEYNNIKQIMKKQLKLFPYDPKKKLRLVIDGACTAGTEFLLIQYVDNKDMKKGIQIIHSRSNVLPLNREISSMEAEAIALDRAIAAFHHWIYYCPEVELISDSRGLRGLLNKYTADVDNRSLQQIQIQAANYNSKYTYIKGKHNRVPDALSRLCKSICS